MRRRILALGILALGSAALPAADALAQAQTYPSRTIRVVVPFSAGSATDIIARTVMEQVSQQVGQPIVVENRVGAAGTLGQAQVAKAEPDGHTLLVNSTSFAVVATTYTNPGYDPVADFVGISGVASLPNVLIVRPGRFKTLKDLVAAAKAAPGKMNYASAGAGSAAHLNGERFRMATGIDVLHIPYKGGPEGVAAVLSGDADFYFVPLPAARGLLASGKIAALAVSGAQRAGALPEIPTTVQAGFPNSEYNFWIGLWAPGKTPKEIVSRLNAEVVKALNNPAVKEKLAKSGGDPLPMTATAFDAFVKSEIEVNRSLVKAAGVKIN